MDPTTIDANVMRASSEVDPADLPLSSTEERVARFARAILVALALAVVLAAVVGAGLTRAGGSSDTSSSARMGGDFPAFYAAGSIILSGDSDDLYLPSRQAEAQRELGVDGYLAFAYPPFVAAAYVPLAAVGYQSAYLIHSLLMAAAFVLALHVLAGPVPLIRRWRWPLLASGLTFYPLFTAIGGGQNASLTILLLAVVWRGLDDGRPAIVGLAAALMMYRPQYALPLIGLLILSRNWRSVGWATLGIGLLWASTAAALGVNWVAQWFEQVLPFVEHDADVNAANSISILGFLQAAWGHDGRIVVVCGAVGAAAVVMALMWMWSQPTRFTLASRMGGLAVGITLISPHTMFYDAGLLVIGGVALLAAVEKQVGGRFTQVGSVRLLALFWASSFVHVVASGLGATPLALVTLIAFCGLVTHAISQQTVPTSREQEMIPESGVGERSNA